jgi:hypothetical protein
MPWEEEFERLRREIADAERRLHGRHTATAVTLTVVALVLLGAMLALTSLLMAH